MVYVISEYSKLQAKKLAVEIKLSSTPNKKLDVFKDGKKVASIGQIGYKDYGVYLKEKGKKYADERRRLYRLRHRGEDNYTLKILW